MRQLIPIVLLLALAGCGAPGTPTSGDQGIHAHPSPAHDPDQPRTAPYSGPMHAPSDTGDDASVAEGAGAAGRALECTGRPFLGYPGDFAQPGEKTLPDGGLDEVASSADGAFDVWLDQLWGLTPTGGYVVERDDGDRQLRSFDVGGRTRVAVILAGDLRDYRGRTGWGVDSWAQCNPAEFPSTVTHDLGLEIALDRGGRRVPTTLVNVMPGSEHCDWQDTTFLELGDPTHPVGGVGRRPDRPLGSYVRDSAGHFPDLLTTTFAARTTLPAGARDTGYRLRGRQLWTASAPSAAYLVTPGNPDESERWPASTRRIGCA